MKSLNINIATWMSYDPKDKNYYFGIGFDGIEELDPLLEIDFIKDMHIATDSFDLSDLYKETPESGFHRYVLRNIQKNIQQILEIQPDKYPFESVTYETEMELLIEDGR